MAGAGVVAMTAVRWSEGLSVGVPSLDADHKTLVGLLKRLEGTGTHEDPATVGAVLETLMAYTHFHFCREEKVMEACGYPHLAAHRDEHEALTRDVRRLRGRYDGDPSAVTRTQLLSFLMTWLNHHILLTDMAYRPYAANRPEADAAAAECGEFGLD